MILAAQNVQWIINTQRTPMNNMTTDARREIGPVFRCRDDVCGLILREDNNGDSILI
jgi:hypothetical protein